MVLLFATRLKHEEILSATSSFKILLQHFCRHVKTPKRVKLRNYCSDIRIIQRIPSIQKSDKITQEDIWVLISDWPEHDNRILAPSVVLYQQKFCSTTNIRGVTTNPIPHFLSLSHSQNLHNFSTIEDIKTIRFP
jgi:hypothetical protein